MAAAVLLRLGFVGVHHAPVGHACLQAVGLSIQLVLLPLDALWQLSLLRRLRLPLRLRGTMQGGLSGGAATAMLVYGCTCVSTMSGGHESQSIHRYSSASSANLCAGGCPQPAGEPGSGSRMLLLQGIQRLLCRLCGGPGKAHMFILQ